MRWASIYWALWHGEGRLLPAQVDELTLAEVELALDVPSDRPRPPEGFQPMTPYQVAAYMAAYRDLPLAERVRRAKEA